MHHDISGWEEIKCNGKTIYRCFAPTRYIRAVWFHVCFTHTHNKFCFLRTSHASTSRSPSLPPSLDSLATVASMSCERVWQQWPVCSDGEWVSCAGPVTSRHERQRLTCGGEQMRAATVGVRWRACSVRGKANKWTVPSGDRTRCDTCRATSGDWGVGTETAEAEEWIGRWRLRTTDACAMKFKTWNLMKPEIWIPTKPYKTPWNCYK